MQTKQCTKCKEIKSLNEFYQRKASTDGHTSQCKQCVTQYYIAHREEKKEYYAVHREEKTEYQRQWGSNNCNRRRIYHQRRRAQKNRTIIDKLTPGQIAELYKRQGDRCLCCGEIKELTIDHIIPLSKDGSNSIDNVQLLCRSCNSKKHTKTIDYRTKPDGKMGRLRPIQPPLPGLALETQGTFNLKGDR